MPMDQDENDSEENNTQTEVMENNEEDFQAEETNGKICGLNLEKSVLQIEIIWYCSSSTLAEILYFLTPTLPA